MINTIGSASYDPAIARSLVPVQPAARGDDPSRRAAPPLPPRAVVPAGELRTGLEGRAGLIYQQNLMDDGINAKNRQAIRAYRTLEDAEEREKVSRMLGVDEYA
ncbi:hypothetical protein [Sedimenticola hydrogenitrophicus]|uniref:hypothetical protein n=1 Tax=Sedimenticola hydrogenitrophicus TaxID=2967975 RepID=UPI0023B0308C|nr:hypothetical protein [Sedimenticola hydrogenitrophicus]